MCRDINSVGRCRKAEETDYGNVPRRVCIFRCATPPFWVWEVFCYFTAKHTFYSEQNISFQVPPASENTTLPHLLCPVPLTEMKAARFYILRRESASPPAQDSFLSPSSDDCFGFFSSWAVTPTLYGKRQRAFIPLRKPFTSRQLERLSVRLALFTLGWVLCKAQAWSPLPHRSKQLMRDGKKERKCLRVLSLFAVCSLLLLLFVAKLY